jgi:O-antigen/teichoic acid export membrane protein
MIEHLKTGILYTALGKYSNVLIQLVINIVLSRVLTPHDYGLVAVVQVFLVFFTTIVDAGLGPAIIQNKSLTEHDNRVLFTYSLLFVVLLCIIFALCGYPISLVYGNPIYIPLSLAMSVTLFFLGINMVPNALLDKMKRFRAVNMRLVLANLCGGIIGVSTAFVGWGAYALVAGLTVPGIVSFILNVWLLRLAPAAHLDKVVLAKVWTFAKNQFGFNLINYFSRNADTILIGKVFGPTAVANYSKAYQLLMMPNNVLLGIINPVLLPILSDYQDDVAYIRQAYLKIVHVLALIGVPLSVFLCIEGHDIIFTLFGNQWGDAVPPFMIVSLTVWIQMTLSSTGAVFQALNKTHQLFITGSLSAAILVSSIVAGVFMGSIDTVAIILSIGFLLNFFLNYSIMMTVVLDSSLVTLLKEFIAPFGIGIVLAAVLLPLKGVIPAFTPIIDLIIYGAITMVLFLLYMSVTGEGRNILKILKP